MSNTEIFSLDLEEGEKWSCLQLFGGFVPDVWCIVAERHVLFCFFRYLMTPEVHIIAVTHSLYFGPGPFGALKTISTIFCRVLQCSTDPGQEVLYCMPLGDII